jgi:hypothetical protein
MKAKVKSRKEQRREQDQQLMVALGLEAHLRNLADDILSGSGKTDARTSENFAEFQQFVQYASPEMKDRLLAFIREQEVQAGKEYIEERNTEWAKKKGDESREKTE